VAFWPDAQIVGLVFISSYANQLRRDIPATDERKVVAIR
jgi:hypothetical protein